MTALAPRPPAATAIGLGALAVLPFAAGAAAAWVGDPAWRGLALQALSSYAAVVISFIGALHWGLAFPQASPAPRLFVWGVVPSIVAWGAVLLPPPTALLVHAATLVACYIVDRAIYPKEHIALWLPLRRWLTIAATLCCLVAAARG